MLGVCEALKAGSEFKKLLWKLGFQKFKKILISQVRFFDYIIIFRSTKMLAQIADLRLCALNVSTPYVCALMSGFDLPGRKPAWQVERRWFDSRWKVRRERIKRSKSLEMQEVREMGRKEDGEEVGFSGLWMGMIEVGFQQEGKVWEYQDLLKRERRRICAGSGKCFSKG